MAHSRRHRSFKASTIFKILGLTEIIGYIMRELFWTIWHIALLVLVRAILVAENGTDFGKSPLFRKLAEISQRREYGIGSGGRPVGSLVH